MRILVTGGGGFLGRRIVERLLEEGHLVRSFQRSAQPDLEQMGAQVMQGDLLDAASLCRAADGCEAVFHVAALAGVWGPKQQFEDINIQGSRNVVQACLATGARSLVYTSTPSVVFSGESFTGQDESLPYGSNWLCDYARTKAVAEQETLAAQGKEGLKVIALRPHLIYGPGDPHLMPRVVARAKQGRLRIVGNGESRVDVTYIDNAAEAHLDALKALETGHPGGKAYFISDGRPVPLWPWINGLLVRLGVQKIERKISLKAAYRIGAVAEGVWKAFRLQGEPPMTRFVATELAKSHFFSIEAAKRDLGYDPDRVSASDALDKTEEWLRQTT